MNNYKDSLQENSNRIERLERNLRDKDEIIGMMNNDMKELEIES